MPPGGATSAVNEEASAREEEFLSVLKMIRGLDEEIALAEARMREAEDKEKGQVEAKLKELAAREWDQPPHRDWEPGDENWQVGLMTDVAMLHRQVARLAAKLGPTSVAERKRSLNVTMGDASFQVAVGADVTMQFVLEQVCLYWDLDSAKYSLQDTDGRVWPLSALATDVDDDRVLLRPVPDDDALVVPLTTKPSAAANNNNDDADDDDNNKLAAAATAALNGGANNNEPEAAPPADLGLDGEDLPEGVLVVRKRRRVAHTSLCWHCEMLVMVILASAFAVVVVAERNVPLAWQTRQAAVNAFVEQVFLPPGATAPAGALSFHALNTVPDVLAWLQGPFRALYTANATAAPLVFAGAAQLAQLRVGSGSCARAPQLAGVAQAPCYATYGPTTASTSPLPGIYAGSTFAGAVNLALWPALTGDTIPGATAYYPVKALGYPVTLSPLASAFDVQLATITSNGWANAGTRLIVLSASLWSAAEQTYLPFMAAFEVLPNGGVLPHWLSTTVSEQNDANFDIVFAVLVCFVVAADWLVAIALRWPLSALAALMDACLVTFIILYAVANAQLRGALAAWQTVWTPTGYSDMRGIAMQYQLVGNFAGVVVVLMACRLLSYLRASPSALLLLGAMQRARGQYLALFFILVVVALALAFVAHFTLGREVFSVSQVSLAFASLGFGAGYELFGTASWSAIVLSALALALLYFWVWFLFVATALLHTMQLGDEARAQGLARLHGKYGALVGAAGRLQGPNEVVSTQRRVVET